jgi:hypothetical protein
MNSFLYFIIDIVFGRWTLQHISKFRIEFQQVQQCFSNKIKLLYILANVGHHQKAFASFIYYRTLPNFCLLSLLFYYNAVSFNSLCLDFENTKFSATGKRGQKMFSAPDPLCGLLFIHILCIV